MKSKSKSSNEALPQQSRTAQPGLLRLQTVPRKRGLFQWWRHLLLPLFLWAALVSAHASHFRYGTVSWEPTATTGQVKFTIIDAFRRSAYAGTAVDGRPAIGDIITENTGVTAFNFGDGGSTGTLRYQVTAIDAAEDFLIGEALNPGTNNRGVLHTYVGAGPFTGQINTSARIGALNNRSSGTYILSTTVRPLSGNSSPKSSLSPVNILPQSATATFLVPGADANGDGLRWRLSTDAEAGGGSSPPNLSVNANTGLVTWNNLGLNTANPWTVQIIIEDLDPSGNVKTQTPVDFLMEIDPTAAGTPPVVTINPSGPVSVLPGNTVIFSVTATDTDAASTVSLNASGLPGGSTMTPALPVTGAGNTGVSSSFSWTPAANQTGSFPIVFTATDNTGRQTSASKTITVTTAPLATAITDPASNEANTSATLNGRVNPNGSPTSVRFEYGITTSYGSATTPVSIGNGNTLVSLSASVPGLTPGTQYHFRIVASNSGGTANGGDRTFTTTGGNRAPIAVNDQFSVPVVGAELDVLANDSDPDNDPLTIQAVSNVLGGNAVPSSGNTRVTFTPTSGLTTGSFDYTISDGRGATATAHVAITLGNRPPVAVNDQFTVPLGVAIELDVLSNDSDPDFDPLTIVSVANGVGGSVVASSANTKATFTPTTNATSGSFDYTISDGRGGTATAHVSIAVTQIVPLIVARPPGSWAVFALGGGVTCADTVVGNTAIDGDAGIALSGGLSLSGRSRLAGDIYLRTYGTVVKSGLPVVNGTTFQSASTDTLLNQGAADANAAAAAAAALAASPAMPATITGATQLSGAGTMVLNVTDLTLGGGAQLTLTGDASTKFILNISGRCTLSAGSVLLAGGIPARNVLINVLGAGPDITLLAGSQMNATLLAVERKVSLGSASSVIGGVVAKKITLTAGASAKRAP